MKLLVGFLSIAAFAQQLAPLRPPAVPLVAHDPYFSVWSMADRLTDEGTKHWTGKPNSLSAAVRVDGKAYQVMGRERGNGAVLEQRRVEVLPTRTIYEFTGAGIALELTFFTPALPDDLDVLSRPLTYIEWKVSSADSREHEVAFYLDAAGDLAVNTPDQAVVWGRYLVDGHTVLRMGSREQAVLAKRGDDLRIDWGYLYLTADRADGVSAVAAPHTTARAAFDSGGRVPDSDNLADVTPARRAPQDVLALSVDLCKVSAQPVTRYAMIAYDDLYSIEYFERRERPWWRRNGAGNERSAARRAQGARYAAGAQ